MLRYSIAALATLAIAFPNAIGQDANYPKVAALLKKTEGKDANAASEKLHAMGASILPDLIHYLEITPGKDRDFASGAALVLPDYGPEAKPALVKCVTSGGLRSRIGVSFAVSYMASMLAGVEDIPEVSPDEANNPEYQQALKVKKQYAWLRDADATSAWVHAAADTDPAVRYCAVSIVSFLRLSDAHLTLQRDLEDPNNQVWQATFEALVRLGRTSDAGTLANSLERRSEMMKANALDKLNMMDPLTKRDTILGPMILRKLLATKNADLRARAVRLLSLHEDPDDVPAIEPLLNDPSEVVRSDSIVALAHILGKGGQKYAPQLVKMSQSSNETVKDDGIRGLGEVGGDEALKRLSELSKSADANIRGEVAEAMGQMYDPRCKPVLRMLAKDKDDQVGVRAKMALDVLGESPQERARVKAQVDQMMNEEPSFMISDPPRSPSLAAKRKP